MTVVYLVPPDTLAAGLSGGAFKPDSHGIAPAWWPGDDKAPAGPVYANPKQVPS